MATGRHSYVRFFPSDWKAGTARMPRELSSMYHDVCLHNWDYVEPLSRAEQAIVFADVVDWKAKVQSLIDMGKLRRNQGGGLYSERAMNEARSSYERKVISVASGKEGAAKRWKNKDNFDGHPNVVPIANQNQNQNQNHKIKKKITSSSKVNGFSLPDWVPQAQWDGWVEMRKATRHPLTDRAKGLAVTKLQELQQQGHDPGKLIDLATERCWLSFYPDDRGGTTLVKPKQEALTL